MVFHFIPWDSIITDWINSSLVVTLSSSFAPRRGNRQFRQTLKGQNLLYFGHLKLRWFYHAAQPCRCLGWSKYHCNLLCFIAFRANCALCLCLRWNLFSLSFIISLVTPTVKQQIDGQNVRRNCLRNYSLISFQSNLLSTHLAALILVHLLWLLEWGEGGENGENRFLSEETTSLERRLLKASETGELCLHITR